MSEPTFGQRFGVVDGTTVYSDFPKRARVGLLYILQDFVERKALDQRALVTEISRMVRDVSGVEERPQLGLELLKQLRWYECFELVERICSTLLHNVGDWVTMDHFEVFETLEEVRESFTREVNQLLWEENIAYEFVNCKFIRRGRPQTQKNIQRATAKVLSEERLRPVARLFVKALDHFDEFPNQDLENCVKDALIALEACAEIVTNQPASKDFNKAMKRLTGSEDRKIPAPISQAITKLHAYRGSGQGAGHAALKGNRISESDAELVLSATAAVITYLVDNFPPEEEDIPF